MSKFMLRRLGVADDPVQYQPNLQACLEAVLECSPMLMDDVLAGLQASLLPVPGKKPTATNPPLLRQAIEVLLEQAPAVRQGFAAHLRTQVYGGQSRRQMDQQAARFEDFQFLDSGQIDANLELSQCQQAVLLAVDVALPSVNAMVGTLMGWSSVQAQLNPFRPASFVHALRETLEDFVTGHAARSGVMALSAGLLGASLDTLYREMADWLRSLGVEPVSAAPNTRTGLWNPADASRSTVARTLDTLEKLRRLLTGDTEPNAAAGAPADFTHTIPVAFEALQDMKLVEPLLKRLSDRASKVVAPLPASLADAKQPGVAGHAQDPNPGLLSALGLQLGREVLLLMLDKLTQDARLLPPVRASLKALEPVLLTLAGRDGRLFSQRLHPARLLLDRVTHRSLAFPNTEASGYAEFQTSMDDALRELIRGPGDAAAFALVLRRLDDGWTDAATEQYRQVAVAARTLRHAEQRNLLAHRLGQQFADRLQGQKVSESVAVFLHGPWAHVAAQAQLGAADGATDPGGYQGLVDDLIWSVQPRLARRDRGRLAQMVPGMLVSLRRGLNLIAYPPDRMAAFFETLISLHGRALDSTRAAAPEPAPQAVAQTGAPAGRGGGDASPFAATPLPAVRSATADAVDPAAHAPALLPPLQQPAVPMAADPSLWSVDALTIGAWVDLALAGNWVRAQLTWASPQRTLFMFISGDGMAHSMSRRTVDRLKKSRLIRPVSEGRVVGKALDAVALAARRNELLAPAQKAKE